MSNAIAIESRVSAVIPVLEVRDVDRALRFYNEILGFREAFRYRTPPSYGGLWLDGFEIHMRRVTHNPRRSMLYVPTSNLDAYYQMIEERGAKIRNRPADQLYGMREFDIEDPDGHVLCFGQYVD
jgi:uncharacterized glyoxalase superfamily protein PhnB